MPLLTYSIHTLGCKVNSYESGVMSEACERCGFTRVPFGENADIVIINTCAVTAESSRKSMQFIRRARKENPAAVIVAVGCFTQISDPESFSDVQVLLGSAEKSRVGEFIREYAATGVPVRRVEKTDKKRPFEPMSAVKNEHTRAFVKVEDGCDNFCSYCIIPYARGRVASKPLNDALTEIKALVASGYREIVLTGIHLDSYGRDIPGSDGLCGLCAAVDEIEGLERLRLGSLEPVFMTEETVSALKALRHLCPQFHLSLQSGCGETLKRMNRRYTPDDYLAAVSRLRTAFGEDTAITTDVIAGFCGETEAEFTESCAFVKKIGFSRIHVFPYSPREGTRAYTMPGHLTNEVKNARAAVLDGIKRSAALSYNLKLVGTVREILCETVSETGNGFVITGHTRSFVPVRATSAAAVTTDELVNILITGADDESCSGETVL